MNHRTYRWVVTALGLLLCQAANGQPVTTLDPHQALLWKEAGLPGKIPYRLLAGSPWLVTQRPAGLQADGAEPTVAVDILSTNPPQTLAALGSIGTLGAQRHGPRITAELTRPAIVTLRRQPEVLAVRPATWVTQAGLVTTQADPAAAVTDGRTRYGVTGRGVRVGVISDSFNALGGMASSVGVDLPPASSLKLVSDRASGTDEGRVMAEVIHDLAPGADLAFASGAGGPAAMVNAILGLSAPGRPHRCHIIVDDLLYLDEPMFADGIIAQAVETAASRGVLYFSSAGNFGRQAIESTWRSSAHVGEYGKPMFDFDPGTGDDPWLAIRVPPGTSYVVLQWQEAYGWLNNLTQGAATDLDLVLYDADEQYTGYGAFYGNTGQDPTEILVLTNHGEDWLNLNLSVQWYTGAPPPPMRLVWMRLEVQEHQTFSPTLYGHANAASAIAVGAAHYPETPAYGQSPPVLARYSAAGGTRIVVSADGSPLDVLRLHPEVVAPDGGNNTFFGADTDQDGWPNFFGTSASAPAMAAVAALAWERGGSLTADHARQALRRSAVDMATPGFDWDTGYGLLDAETFVGKLITDVNGNGCVDIQDLWQVYTQTLYSAPDLRYDLNGDYGVDSQDMDLVVANFDNYGSRCR